MQKISEKKQKIILRVMLIIGLLPFAGALGSAIYYAFAGVPEFSLFVPPTQYLYGWDAFAYTIMWDGLFFAMFWYITIPWIIFLFIVPIVLLIKDKIKK